MNREQLIEELLNKNIIKIGEIINYKRFKQIHSNGYSHISEYDFAEMLGINSGNFNNVKNRGQNAIILKELIPMQEEKLAKEISEDLLQKLEAGQRINYEQFCDLRESYCAIYGDISEVKFGRILELNYDSLYKLRRGKEILIFKSKFSSEEIIQALIQEGIAVPGDKINYSKFSEIYEDARKKHPSINHFSQYAFAKLLGIRKSNFTKFKTTPVNLQILKSYMPKKKKVYVVSDEERMLIVKNLISTKNAKPYEFCDYQRFLELYQGYENISEYNFAYILDMSSTSFSLIKNSGKKARILKDCLDKEQIITELIESGKLQIGEEIDYIKFSELFKEYEYLGVFLFADIIEVSEGNIERLRTNSGSTTSALRSRIKKEEEQENSYNDVREQAKAYVEELFETGKIHIGQEIDYQSFQEIYLPCSYISENEFATLLGISGLRYQNIRYSGTKTYIHDYKVAEAVKLIGNIEKNRYFSKEEIEDICNRYGITKEDFITYFVYREKFRYNSNSQAYVDALESHNKIYIGRTRMSNEYFERTYPLFLEPVKRLVGTMCKRYRMLNHMEDLESEAIMYMFQNCGDIEKNFSDCKDNQTLINMIIGRLKIFLSEKMINQLKISNKFRSASHFYEKVKSKGDISSDNYNTEETALESVMDETTESKVMCELIRRFENGMDKAELLESIQIDFGISKEALLKLLSKRVELKKRNKGTVDVSIGE